MALRQQWRTQANDYEAQLKLMAARIQDLTAKMAVADKQVRVAALSFASKTEPNTVPN